MCVLAIYPTSPQPQHPWQYPPNKTTPAQCNVTDHPQMFVARSPSSGWQCNLMLATSHIALSEVPGCITRALLDQKLQLLMRTLPRDFGYSKERVRGCSAAASARLGCLSLLLSQSTSAESPTKAAAKLAAPLRPYSTHPHPSPKDIKPQPLTSNLPTQTPAPTPTPTPTPTRKGPHCSRRPEPPLRRMRPDGARRGNHHRPLAGRPARIASARVAGGPRAARYHVGATRARVQGRGGGE